MRQDRPDSEETTAGQLNALWIFWKNRNALQSKIQVKKTQLHLDQGVGFEGVFKDEGPLLEEVRLREAGEGDFGYRSAYITNTIVNVCEDIQEGRGR